MSDVIIIGGGAAGLFCALEAGKRGRSVTVIERNAQPGRKIIISGGGRCNFTNLDVTADNFISKNPHFCKSALAQYTPADIILLVRKHKIPFYQKTLGQLFCRGRSYAIVEMLLDECKSAGVWLVTDCSVKKIEKSEKFYVESTKGKFESDSIVIATGGLSFPRIGTTDFGYRIARQFGLKVVETRPSVVPLRFGDQDFSDLSGLSVEAIVKTDGHDFRENILSTHRGLSGPAVLQISNYWDPNREVHFDLLPDVETLELFKQNRGKGVKIKNLLSSYLPQRLVEVLLPKTLADLPLNRADDTTLSKTASMINDWIVKFSLTEGWQKAEVTLGGIDTNEVSSKTMESRKVPGLYFIGEVLDVTGWLGGYNFQWAWSSGYACGHSV